MRLGVLDVGSNTVHLLVVDAHRGARPTPMHSEKTVLRLVERVSADGELDKKVVDELVLTIARAKEAAQRHGCEELLAFATSAIRDVSNASEVLERIVDETGIELRVLTGEQEARLTFLAARRWFGWSVGRLLVLDIGGGSLEVALGDDEEPELAESWPVGAGRITRTRFVNDPPTRPEVVSTTAWLDDQLGGLAERVAAVGVPDRVVGTSRMLQSLARLTGAAPSSAGPYVRRVLTHAGLRQLIAFISRMSSDDLAQLEGVSSSRAHQLVAGALVAESTMRALSLDSLEICPWALREGVILQRLDHSDSADRTALLTGWRRGA